MMNIDSSSRSGPSKKRKDNDVRANVPNVSNNINRSGVDEHDVSYSNKSATCNNDTSSSQLDRMETMMMRMEQKLASTSSLESRCAELEAKCSSLENKLEASSMLMIEKFDSLNINLDKKCSMLEDKMEKLYKYNDMLVRNQSWMYSVETKSKEEWLERGYSNDDARYLAWASEELKDVTTQMRMREWESIDDMMCRINLYCTPCHSEGVDHSDELLPAWREFAQTLKHFSPVINLLPESSESCFELDKVHLHGVASTLVKEALIGMPFKRLSFTHCISPGGTEHNVLGGLSVDAIMDVAESNKHLRTLEIQRNCMNRDQIDRLCSIVHNHPSLEELTVDNCIDEAIGNAQLGDSMLTSLLSGGELRLETLNLEENCITPAVGTILADFLASNPPLKSLDLKLNRLDDNVATSVANALRSNNTLRELKLGTIYDRNGIGITGVGFKAITSILFDESSLNAVADSNHTLERFDHRIAIYNPMDLSSNVNRGAKIYFLLSKRNTTLSNVEHFDDIDVKILPNMLESVQRYAQSARLRQKGLCAPPIYEPVESLSIVYEVMRRWGKVFNLYE